jgi:hypothetical protein
LNGPLGDAARALWESGYSFDYVSDRLLEPMQAAGRPIQGPNGATWQAVVVPECRQMPHTTLAKLLSLAEQGATVIFQNRLPEDVPGLGHLDERRAALETLLKPLAIRSEDTASVRVLRRGKGRVLIGTLDQAPLSAGVTREPLVDHSGVKCIRRRHDQGRHYFIVNHSLEPLDGWNLLATAAQAVVVMDPMTGKTVIARVRQAEAGSVAVYLRLEPGHSIILRTLERNHIAGPPCTWPKPGEAVTEIDGPWQVEFIAGGPKLPKPLQMTELKSWTSGDDPAGESFAGTARYRCQFDLDAAPSISGQRTPILLDLGEVKHVARVRLNGEDLGVRFMHPYRLPIPAGLIRTQGNLLEVEVTNLAANRIRDLDRRKVSWRIFHDINLVNIQYRPFDASSWPVFDSGLLGPVTICR